MKLLYAFPEALPLPKARGLQVAWMTEALCAAGVEVTLAHGPSPDGHPLVPIGREQLPEGLTLLPVTRHWPFPLQRWHSVARFAYLLKEHMRRHPPEIVFVRHFKLAYRLLRARPDLPLVYEAHECFAATAPAAKRAELAAQEAYVLARAAGVVHISRALRDALLSQYRIGGAEIVLHSGVNVPAERPGKDWENCGRHVVYVGSFFDWKGVDDLVAAAQHLPGCRIALVGGEPGDIERLERQIPPSGAAVELLPRLPAEKAMKYLLDACIAVLPNRSEGISQFTSPLKLFEYMGAGCAVVAADLPSIREVLPPQGCGWFSPADPASLAKAISRFAANPQIARAQGENLRSLAENYTWAARANALAAFLASILADFRPSGTNPA
jgi:glycosyltransferase involved in cell wall biosynthesis